jgi:RNase P/RNase MRP subunit p29
MVAQGHCVDDQETPIFEFDRHHLQGDSVRVVPEIKQPRIGVSGSPWRRVLLEAQTAMLDDVSRAFT